MRRFFVASAAAHLGLLVLFLLLPNLGMPRPIGLEVYAVELVQLPPESRGPEEERAEEIRQPEPEQKAEEPEPDPIPEEPARKPRMVPVKPPPPPPEKTLEERINERMRSRDESRAPERSQAEKEELQPTTGTTTITAGEVADYYLTMLQGKITRNWKQPSARFSGGDELTVRVAFRILKDGSVTGLGVVRSSGWATVDQSAIQAVRSSAPFGAFPPTYTSDRLDVMIDFTVRPD